MSEPVDHLGRMMLIWNWIEAWLQIAAPESLAHLYKGATEQQLHAVETALGLPLPADLKASWSLHNGTVEFFFGAGDFSPLSRWLRPTEQSKLSRIGLRPLFLLQPMGVVDLSAWTWVEAQGNRWGASSSLTMNWVRTLLPLIFGVSCLVLSTIWRMENMRWMRLEDW
ncbi:MAG TPA: SMI1/KNR4 family protein [Ktedonobacteraceae bacterium]|nr:SMI1/KNR4 family protein [Ktedonobacteraceae bacterium]